MLLSEMPGHEYPLLAIFPFRWYETNRWIIRALKLRPNGELKWMHYSIESNGHAKAQAFVQYEDALEEATAFNLGISTRVAELDFQAETRTSITLKVEKEITVLKRLADEEHLMLNEAVKRNAHLPRPRSEDLILPTGLESLRGQLLEQITQAPYIQIAHLPHWGMVLARTGELDWTHRLTPTKKTSSVAVVRQLPEDLACLVPTIGGKPKPPFEQCFCPERINFCSMPAFKKYCSKPEHAVSESW